MSPRLRLVVFVLACLAALPGFVHVVLHMPHFGAHPLPYGEMINAIGVRERHVTNMVSAVNFDYRGFDTLGEEFILLGAVTGVTVLLRGTRGEDEADHPGEVKGRPILPPSEASMLICRMFGAFTLVFGIEVAIHAMTTPGGGFQGGVIIATATLLMFLDEGYGGWRKLIGSEMMDRLEGGGATAYALCGFASMVMGAPFLYNMLPLGKAGTLLSGGLMLIENAGVTLAVAGGFGVIFLEFLEETRRPDERDEP